MSEVDGRAFVSVLRESPVERQPSKLSKNHFATRLDIGSPTGHAQE